MNEETLPPSPNWYLSNVLACTADGTIAYGAKNNIVIAKYLPGYSAVLHLRSLSSVMLIKNGLLLLLSRQAEKIATNTGTAWHLLVMTL